jgi:hypothetical protein
MRDIAEFFFFSFFMYVFPNRMGKEGSKSKGLFSRECGAAFKVIFSKKEKKKTSDGSGMGVWIYTQGSSMDGSHACIYSFDSS